MGNILKILFSVIFGLVLFYLSSTIYMHSQKPKDLLPIAVDSLSWQTYKNDMHGFEIQYPSTWIVESSAPSIFITNTLEVENINILTPAYGKAWQSKAFLTISFLRNREAYSLEQWYDERKKGNPMSNGRLESPIQIGGKKTIMEGISDRDGYQYYYIEDDSGIIQIGYRTHQTNFSSLYENMLSSFKFLK